MKPLWFEAAAATNTGLPVRPGAISAMILTVAGALAYTGGWLSPLRLTQDPTMAAFEDANGMHAGFCRNHAWCLEANKHRPRGFDTCLRSGSVSDGDDSLSPDEMMSGHAIASHHRVITATVHEQFGEDA